MRPNPIPPAPNQESVWDYPLPPRIEDVTKHIRIIFNCELIADTNCCKRRGSSRGRIERTEFNYPIPLP